jgi:GGDEF domain-containing protein
MPILSQERPEADLIHEARTDKLTKLLNRHTTETQLQKIIATGLRHRLHVGVRF